MRSQVEAAYEAVRREHLLPPTIAAIPRLETPTTRYPSPSSTTSSEGTRPDTSSHLTGDPGDPSRRIPPPQANVPQQRWGMAGGGVSSHSDVVGQPSRKRQRQRSNSNDSGSDVSGKKQGRASRGGTVEMISTLCSTRFSTRRGHTVATSLVDRLRHD
jgi:hypothetical protein